MLSEIIVPLLYTQKLKNYTKCQAEWELIIPCMETISRRCQPMGPTGKIE